MKIFTKTVPDIKFRNLDQSAFPDLAEPVIFLIHTDSYSASDILSFQKFLSVQEQEKAARFRFIKDQHSYIITHGMLRTILGGYHKSEPSEIKFITNEFGKPSLSEKLEKIHFNISHRAGLSALAFSTKSEIGVDIEKIDPEFEFDLIVKAHFSVAENHFIHEIEAKARERFYTLWTRKEALLKALGIGIGENLDVEVFRNVNHFNPEVPFPIIQEADYYLNTFKYQDNYMITTVGSNPGGFRVTKDLHFNN